MDKILWKILVWIWKRRAMKMYGGPGEKGELFNTACFRHAVSSTTRSITDDFSAENILISSGFYAGKGGCHWYDCAPKDITKTKEEQ